MKVIGLSLILALTFVPLSHAQIIAVNFNNTYQPSPENIAADTGAGAGFLAMADWNNVTAPQGTNYNGPLIDSNGHIVSGLNFTAVYSGPYETQNTALGNLLNGYGDHFSSLTINNIPYATYDLYVYVASDGDGRDATGTHLPRGDRLSGTDRARPDPMGSTRSSTAQTSPRVS